jgi:hypothetical protein
VTHQGQKSPENSQNNDPENTLNEIKISTEKNISSLDSQETLDDIWALVLDIVRHTNKNRDYISLEPEQSLTNRRMIFRKK